MTLDLLQKQLNHFKANHLTRKRINIENKNLSRVIIDGKKLINFCSNDYLGLSVHPRVIQAFVTGAQHYGLGSGASAIVSGFHKPHRLLEEKFAEFLNRDRALLFNSGYHANLGVITTFANRKTSVIADKLCHASILDGIHLSRAKHHRYHHLNYLHAEKILDQINQRCLLITESVFSMEGNISPIPKLSDLAKKYKAMLIVDDAHGVGVLGSGGRGICDYYHLTQTDIPCLMTAFGKGIGSLGAVVTGSEQLIDGLIQFARTYRYTTALPPAIACATLECLKIIDLETWRREKLTKLIQHFIQLSKAYALPLISTDLTPIKSILIGDAKRGLEITERLRNQGYLVSCIRPPTVPKNCTRIRVSLNCLHTEKEIEHLLESIYHAYRL